MLLSDDGRIDPLRCYRRKPLLEAGPGTRPVWWGRTEIQTLIPHRPPFLLVDEVLSLHHAQRGLIASKRVQPEDPVFGGHFPGQPVYPGVLLLELMAQAALCLYALERQDDDPAVEGARLLGVAEASFLASVGPGADLLVQTRLVGSDPLSATAFAQILSEGRVAALSSLEMYLGR